MGADDATSVDEETSVVPQQSQPHRPAAVTNADTTVELRRTARVITPPERYGLAYSHAVESTGLKEPRIFNEAMKSDEREQQC